MVLHKLDQRLVMMMLIISGDDSDDDRDSDDVSGDICLRHYNESISSKGFLSLRRGVVTR